MMSVKLIIAKLKINSAAMSAVAAAIAASISAYQTSIIVDSRKDAFEQTRVVKQLESCLEMIQAYEDFSGSLSDYDKSWGESYVPSIPVPGPSENVINPDKVADFRKDDVFDRFLTQRRFQNRLLIVLEKSKLFAVNNEFKEIDQFANEIKEVIVWRSGISGHLQLLESGFTKATENCRNQILSKLK